MQHRNAVSFHRQDFIDQVSPIRDELSLNRRTDRGASPSAVATDEEHQFGSPISNS